MSDILFHPLADIFPLLEGDAFDELVADIKANGLREKMDLYEGKIIDGRNRHRALQRLGIDPSADPKKYFRKAIYAHTTGGDIAPHEQDNDARVRAYVISKNIHRRHLTAEQRRDLLVKLVAAQPEKADRVIAREAKVDHKQVSRARRKAEATGAIAPVEKRTGADGKARKQPVKKATASTKDRAQTTEKARKPTKRQLELEEYRRQQDEEADRALAVLAERLGDDGLAILAAAMHHVGPSLQNAVRRKFDDSESDDHKRIYWYSDNFSDYLAKRDRPIRDLEIEAQERDAALDAAAQARIAALDGAAARPTENAPPPDVGADNMRAQIAALDDGAAA
jgi:hypothetical protein